MTRLGLYNSSEMVVQSAPEEDVEVIDISFLSGEHLTLTPNIADKMSGPVNHSYERRRERWLAFVRTVGTCRVIV